MWHHHTKWTRLPEATAAAIVPVKTLTLSNGKTFQAVLLRFDLVIKTVNDCVSESVRMLCI